MSAHGRIRVESEGREGVWLPERDDLVAYLETLDESIHCLVGASVLIGADWPRNRVVDEVRGAKRVAILTGEAARGNLGHALSAIVEDGTGEHLRMFDIGDVSAVILPPAATAILSVRDG